MLKSVLVPINKAGYPFIAIFAFITLAIFHASIALGWVCVVLTLWCIFFFRDPVRVTPDRDGLIISPADGVVQSIKPASPPKELKMPKGDYVRIAVFMNVFNVHVNRAPISGLIKKIVYYPGKFFNASLDKASEHNERHGIYLETKDGTPVGFVQIAGLIARRILCYASEGQEIKVGERYGLIRFGSRVDVYLPKKVAPLVIEGQIMVAGETVLADLNSKEAQRHGTHG